MAIALVGTYAVSYASTNVKAEKLLKPDPCTVTVTKNCSGSGTIETGSATSPSGDCNAASIVAQQQWGNNCVRATITKLMEATPPDQP
ncbi:hypothetical protein [Halpernia humi]|uniref:hypothetical protein n=1 Tax=Halpernia humi TaxID=493375 RepID=UPI0011B06014|nr:hypothetical protein [Halpernia humi]